MPDFPQGTAREHLRSDKRALGIAPAPSFYEGALIMRIFALFLSCALCLSGAARAQSARAPLYDAVIKHDLVKVRALLTHGTPVDSHGSGQLTVLNYAAANGDLPMIELLVAHGAKINGDSEKGYTPLMYATGGGMAGTAVVSFLLSHGANVSAKSIEGYTPLHFAALYAGKPEVVVLLLRHGAAIDAMDRDYDRPLTLAAKNKKKALVQTLLAHGADGAYAIVWESYGNDIDGVRMLLDAGVNVDARFTGQSGTYTGSTALIEAGRQDNLQMARLLLNRGANPNIVEPGDYNMTTALHWAAYQCNGSMIDVLRRHGAVLNLRANGQTAYVLARGGVTKTMQPCDADVLSALEI